MNIADKMTKIANGQQEIYVAGYAAGLANLIDDSNVGSSAWSSKHTVDTLCPTFTKSGSVVVCEPVEGYPLGVVSKIVPMQSGSGDPSPENVRPISGHTAVKVNRCGKNLLASVIKGYDAYWVDNDGTFVSENTVATYVYGLLDLSAGVTYTFSCYVKPTNGGTFQLTVRDSQLKVRGATYVSAEGRYSVTYTPNESGTYRLTAGGTDRDNGVTISQMQIEIGATATAYEPYRGDEFTIDLGQTVYGGSLDWSTGLLTVNYAKWIMNGSVNWQHGTSSNPEVAAMVFPSGNLNMARKNTAFCSHFARGKDDGTVGQFWVNRSSAVDYNVRFMVPITIANSKAEWLAYIAEHPIELCYELAEPFTIQLTPQEIIALSGVNTLYADTGDIEVTGKADPTAIIQDLCNKVNALSATVTALTGV